MRYDDLHIQTRRERPARARSEGEAMLARAGYRDSDGRLTKLGGRAVARLESALAKSRAEELQHVLDMPIIRTAGGETFAEFDGDLELLHCNQCGYAERAELAVAKKPASFQSPPEPVERVATPDCSTIEALAAFLGVTTAATAKALLYSRKSTGELVIVVVRGDFQLSEAKLRSLIGEVQPATPWEISAAGAVPGYASPICLSRGKVIVDDLIPASPNLVAGANEAGFHLLNTNYGRDYQADRVADLTLAQPGDACIRCGAALQATRGALIADGKRTYPENLLVALAETHRDAHGLVFPAGLGPFDVYIVQLPGGAIDTLTDARAMHGVLEVAGLMCLLDDREQRAGVKFNDADLIGLPYRVIISAKNLENRMVELKARTETTPELVPTDGLVSALQSRLQSSK